jgi:acyl-CoA synthetase (NDP forming)/GNAT superfamily N-acetyltransferase
VLQTIDTTSPSGPVDVIVRDGSTVRVRPVTIADEGALHAFLEGLSPDSRSFRFLSLGVDLRRAARDAARAEPPDRYGLVALGEDGTIVAHAMYVVDAPGRAEVAFAVADDLRGHGLGTVLLGLLAAEARRNGIERFVALVRADNRRMAGVFRDCGFPASIRARSGHLDVELPTSLTEEALAAFEDRSRVAATAAVRHFLEPASIAVVGASDRVGSVGAAVMTNLLTSFSGPLHPVNPRHDVVAGRPAYARVSDIPEGVELAVVAVPARAVAAVARDCGRAGVRGLLVLSAGFEQGPGGRRRRGELLRICRRYGMRLVGPNCLGVAATTPEHRLEATFARRSPLAGAIALSTQSGGVAIAAVEAGRGRGIGFSSVVSIGDRVDVSSNDMLRYWEQDPSTSVIGLYLESFGNPRHFARIARRVGRSKPILAVKSGRASAGARAAASHTAALVSGGDVPVDALFRQAGVIRVDTLRELLDASALLASQPLPAGRRVGILTNAGGPGIMCADACEAAGLLVPELGSAARRRLRRALRNGASAGNPVDLLGDATPEDYARAACALLAEDELDALIVLFVPLRITAPADVASALAGALREAPPRKPVLAAFMGEEGAPPALRNGGFALPCFEGPEDAALALARAARYADWRRRPAPEPVDLAPAPRTDDATALIAGALGSGGGWMSAGAVADLAACYGLPLVTVREAATAAEAGRVAAGLRGPVALKAVAPGLVHKTDAGGVRTGLAGAAAVRRAATTMRAEVAQAGFELSGYLVQPMVADGVEMHVGVTTDRHFGPLVAVAAGGTAAELVADVAVRLTPLEAGEAGAMIRSLSTFPLLDGYRGAPRLDAAALEDVVERIAALAEAHPEIAELDCNPVFVGTSGARIVDMRVRVEPSGPADSLPGTRPVP